MQSVRSLKYIGNLGNNGINAGKKVLVNNNDENNLVSPKKTDKEDKGGSSQIQQKQKVNVFRLLFSGCPWNYVMFGDCFDF